MISFKNGFHFAGFWWFGMCKLQYQVIFVRKWNIHLASMLPRMALVDKENLCRYRYIVSDGHLVPLRNCCSILFQCASFKSIKKSFVWIMNKTAWNKFHRLFRRHRSAISRSLSTFWSASLASTSGCPTKPCENAFVLSKIRARFYENLFA